MDDRTRMAHITMLKLMEGDANGFNRHSSLSQFELVQQAVSITDQLIKELEATKNGK